MALRDIIADRIPHVDVWFHRYDKNGKDIEGRCSSPKHPLAVSHPLTVTFHTR